MKNALERRNQILKLLQKNGTVQNQELVDMFGVTPATIRRDLDYLEEKRGADPGLGQGDAGLRRQPGGPTSAAGKPGPG